MKENLSLFQKTLLRVYPFFSKENFLIVTSREFFDLAKQQAEEISSSFANCIITEPASKNTAFALHVALGFWQKDKPFEKEDTILVLPSDHHFSSDEKLRDKIIQANATASQGYHMIFGVPPTYPETGYGYILPSDSQEEFKHVARFTEKPDIETATLFYLSRKYLWNSGLFLFNAAKIASEMKSLYLQGKSSFEDLPSLSIDKAILEKCDGLKVTELGVEWVDLGDWKRLLNHLPKDERGNITINRAFQKECYNCALIGGKKKMVAIGIEDALIIETSDEIFVISLDKLEGLKEIRKELASL